MKTYTVGQIFRLGLLKNRYGKPYGHKGTVRNTIVKHLKYKVGKSKWGDTILVSEAEIKRYNAKYEKKD